MMQGRFSGGLSALIAVFIFVTAAASAENITPLVLYKNSLENNLELRQLDVEYRQSGIDLKAAKAARLPSVDFQTSLSWLSQPMIEPIRLKAGELGVYEFQGYSIMLPLEDMTIYEGMENTHYEFKFILEQPVYTWGKITNSINLYSEVEEISTLKLESKRNEIKTRIYIYFYALKYIRKIDTGLAEQMQNVERLIILAEEAYKNGFLLYTELLEAKIQKKQLEIAVAELTEQKAQAMLSLSQLSGMNNIAPEDLNFSGLEDIEEIKLNTPEHYLNQALSKNPDIAMLSRLRKINELKTEISRGSTEFKPDIGIHLELGYSGPRFPFIERDWYGQDSLNLTATMALQSTIYEGGKPSIQVEKDLQELEKSFYQYELGVETISDLINESVLKLELNRHNIEYYQLLQENDRQQLEMKQTLFDAGSGSETDVIAERINLTLHMIDEFRESIVFFSNYFTILGVSGFTG